MGSFGKLLISSSTIAGVKSRSTTAASSDQFGFSVSVGGLGRRNGSFARCSGGNRRMRRREGVFFASMKVDHHIQPAMVMGEHMQPAMVIEEQMLPAICAEFTILATVNVRRSKKESFKDRVSNRLDAMAEIVGRNVSLMVISTDIDPGT